MEDLLKAIDEALASKGLSAAAASKQAVGHVQFIKNLRTKRGDKGNTHPIEALRLLADVLDQEFYFGPPRPQPIADDQLAGDEFARISMYDAPLSAGPGRLPTNETPVAEVALQRDWFTRNRVNPMNCIALTVSGDSMEPTLWDGDTVLIDQNEREIIDHRIYAFRDGEEMRVKRMIKSVGSLILMSDNRAHPPETRIGPDADMIEILGRIVWSGHVHDS